VSERGTWRSFAEIPLSDASGFLFLQVEDLERVIWRGKCINKKVKEDIGASLICSIFTFYWLVF
jgi:hypothetical protein